MFVIEEAEKTLIPVLTLRIHSYPSQ